MSKKLYEESDVQAIANAIRTKNGLTDTYTISQMAAAISAIETGGGGGDQPQLHAPTISISEDTLTITPNKNNGNFVTGYNVYVNPGTGYVLFGTTTTLTNDLTQYPVPPSDYSIKVTAVGENFIESDYSNELNYTNVFYTVTNTLTNCTSNNSTTSIRKGSAYSATISPDSGYQMKGATVLITMGGADITSAAYSDNTITIVAVTGNIVINITAPAIIGPQWIETTSPSSVYYNHVSSVAGAIYANHVVSRSSNNPGYSSIAKSSDGINWEMIGTVNKNTLYDQDGISQPFIFGENGVVIYPSSTSFVFYSNTSSLTTWEYKTVISSYANYRPLRSAFYGGGKFVLIYGGGQGQKCSIFTSSNGQDWSSYKLTDTSNDTKLFGAYLNGIYYVFIGGEDKTFYTSEDGTNWEKHASTVNFPNSFSGKAQQIIRSPAIYADNKYVIRTSNGSVYSTNGVDWNNASAGSSLTSNDLKPVVYFNNMFISTDSISADGINWTQTNNGLALHDLDVLDNKLVGVTSYGTFYYATE